MLLGLYCDISNAGGWGLGLWLRGVTRLAQFGVGKCIKVLCDGYYLVRTAREGSRVGMAGLVDALLGLAFPRLNYLWLIELAKWFFDMYDKPES